MAAAAEYGRPDRAPILSVVVPFYGVERYIEQCLASLRAQTLTDLEVICVDDGSLDNSLAIAERFAYDDQRFRVIRQQNAGLGPARNTGATHARGRYLAFVDSDDVVAPRAYSLMVDTLEQTGSDFAAGNAFRFGTSAGVVQSWTHDRPFRESAMRTNLEQRPDLVADQMVWNKVYRRRFWQDHALTFPAIRYEDYPVTLAAYLAATAIDVHAEHVYLWRDRDSGDSITQLIEQPDNAIDRAISAQQVLDVMAGNDASPEVRRRIESRFVNVDVVTLARAAAASPAERRDELFSQVVNLANQLDPAHASGATRLARVLHQAARAGDRSLVTQLATWRTARTRSGLARLMRRPRRSLLPLLADAAVGGRRLSNPRRARRLRASIDHLEWRGEELHFRAHYRLQPQIDRFTTASATVSSGVNVVPVMLTATPGGVVVGWIPVGALRSAGPWVLRLTLSVMSMRWEGTVTVEASALPEPLLIGEVAVQPREWGRAFAIERVEHPTIVRAHVTDAQMRLENVVGAQQPLLLRRPAPSADVQLSVDTDVQAASLVVGDPADDPISDIAERDVTLETVATPGAPWYELVRSDIEVRQPPPLLTGHLLLAGNPAATVANGRQISLTRGRHGGLVVRHEAGGDAPR